MDIRENSADAGFGYLQTKINKLNTFFSMIFTELNQQEKNLLEEKIIEVYKNKGITFDDESLYYQDSNNKFITEKRFKKANDMPILKELYELLELEEETKKIANLLKPYIDGSMKFLNGYTNIKIENQFVVADIHNVEEKNLSAIMFVITEFFWDKIKKSKSQKKILYLDEVWRLIDSNEETANFVFKMFKTIRKYGGAATAITQDINDFFCFCRHNLYLLTTYPRRWFFQIHSCRPEPSPYRLPTGRRRSPHQDCIAARSCRTRPARYR